MNVFPLMSLTDIPLRNIMKFLQPADYRALTLVSRKFYNLPEFLNCHTIKITTSEFNDLLSISLREYKSFIVEIDICLAAEKKAMHEYFRMYGGEVTQFTLKSDYGDNSFLTCTDIAGMIIQMPKLEHLIIEEPLVFDAWNNFPTGLIKVPPIKFFQFEQIQQNFLYAGLRQFWFSRVQAIKVPHVSEKNHFLELIGACSENLKDLEIEGKQICNNIELFTNSDYNLERLVIRSNGPSNGGLANFIRSQKGLKEFVYYDSIPKSILRIVITELKELEYLSIRSQFTLTSDEMERICNLPKLKKLGILTQNAAPFNVRLAKSQRIVHLEVNPKNWEEEIPRLIYHFPHIEQFEYMDGFIKSDKILIEVLKNWTNLKKLSILDLSSQISDASFLDLKNLQNLEEIDIQSSNLEYSFLFSTPLPKLKFLRLDGFKDISPDFFVSRNFELFGRNFPNLLEIELINQHNLNDYELMDICRNMTKLKKITLYKMKNPSVGTALNIIKTCKNLNFMMLPDSSISFKEKYKDIVHFLTHSHRKIKILFYKITRKSIALKAMGID